MSKEAHEMEIFFKENGVKYRTIYKEKDRESSILPPEGIHSYRPSEFEGLKKMILRQQGKLED